MIGAFDFCAFGQMWNEVHSTAFVFVEMVRGGEVAVRLFYVLYADLVGMWVLLGGVRRGTNMAQE